MTMGHDHKPDLEAFVDNLKAPVPIHKKLFFFLKNNAKKFVTAKSCCGNPGEPGC